MVKNIWGGVFLTVGLLWGAMGFLIWVSRLKDAITLVGEVAMRNLIYFVVVPSLVFIFMSIISAIRSGE